MIDGNFRSAAQLALQIVFGPPLLVMKIPVLVTGLLGASLSICAALDANNNQQSDVWEMVFKVSGLAGSGDADKDGWSNASESLAGTNPLDPQSYPTMSLAPASGGNMAAGWWGAAGKRYTIETRAELGSGSWTPMPGSALTGEGAWAQMGLTPGGPQGFFRLKVADFDADGDGINDWEERAVGFDPLRDRTDRFPQFDSQRLAAGLTAANTITVSVYDDATSETWPDPAVLVVRRAGGLQPLDVNVSFAGTATRGIDYTTMPGNVVKFPPGVREVFVEVNAVNDSEKDEGDETVIFTVQTGPGYTVGAPNAGTVKVTEPHTSNQVSAKEAARFLIQAAFGPDQDAPSDTDQIPENVEEVMASGIDSWIETQFTRPVGTLRPFVQWAKAQPAAMHIYNDTKQDAWWGRVMGLPKLRPDAVATQLPDPLRQRVGFALSQIFVISDRMETIGVQPEGMVAFYDMLLSHAFGNFRDLLYDVSMHPCMGIYLSHLHNERPNPAANTFPDENYAREVMQLFSIGLWMLNQDGTRQLDAQNQPIPTYTNANITENARVFTGLSFGGTNTNFGASEGDLTVLMKGFDAEHDLEPKNLFGTMLPLRTASAGSTGTATLADVNALIDILFNHQNTGPFIARLLIQRMVTSNPSPAYIGRVAAKFANNGAGVRGDMKAVIKAILMDPEARSSAMLNDPTFGKLREPMLKCVYLARAFNAISEEGWYYLGNFDLDHVQMPFNSPSVFNYYLPTYTPPGALAQAGLVAPEFQIINASSGVAAPNYFWNVTGGAGLNRWGVETRTPSRSVQLNLNAEMLMNIPAAGIGNPNPSVTALDPDPLIRRLDLALTGGTLTPRTCQIIREAMNRMTSGYDWPRNRLRIAIYLIVTSPEFAVQR